MSKLIQTLLFLNLKATLPNAYQKLDILTQIQNNLSNLEHLVPQLARANKKYKCAIDLGYAYAHTPLDEETIKPTSFLFGDKLFAFIRCFYGLKGLRNFFTKQMMTFFKTLIEQGFALVYIDDILLLLNSKEYMFQLKEQLHIINTKNRLKLAPEKSFFMLLRLNSLDMKLAKIQSNLFTQKMKLFTKSLFPLDKLT